LPSGYTWTECPRWHGGRFYFSDELSGRVLAVEPGGEPETVVDLRSRHGIDSSEVIAVGTGFLPDGRLLINSMLERVTLVWDGSTLDTYADFTSITDTPINDIVVDADGRAYVSQIGYDVFHGEPFRQAPIMIIEPDGRTRIAHEAGLMSGPNGMAISEDGSVLVVAEPNAKRISAFDRDPFGALTGRRVFVQLEHAPDGICMDVDGAVWAALPYGGGAVRILEGGQIDARVSVPPERGGKAIACVLGDEDRKTLYICCGFDMLDFEKSRRESKGSIWTARVSVPGGACRP
jgi:sugar lactone lactonase YvrE